MTTVHAQPSRREVLRASAVVGTTALLAGAPSVAPANPPDGVLDLYINEGMVVMVDDSLVYMRGFGERGTTIEDAAPSLSITPRLFTASGLLVENRAFPADAKLPPHGRPEPAGDDPTAPGHSLIHRAYWASYFPRRTILAETGATIRLRVHNGLSQTHGFTIDGVTTTGPIAPGAMKRLEFTAPAAGTYIYHDGTNGIVERVLGLYGVLVVAPAEDHWRIRAGGAEFERQWLWITADIDADWARRAHAGETIDPVKTPLLPRYFVLNDRSGFRALGVSEDEAINLAAHEESLAAGSARRVDVRNFSFEGTTTTVQTGQLIRLVNAGVALRQMHFHGNHVWTLGHGDREFSRSVATLDAEGHVELQAWEDTVELDALTSTHVMLPFKKPPDTLDAVWAARDTDWHYPMHCHAEISQSAAGGLYPGGIIADWVLASPRPSHVEHEQFATQVAMSSGQPHEGSPVTEFRQTPDRAFNLKFFNRRMRFPDGAEHLIWSFESPTSGRAFPAPLIRVTEGETVHATLKPSKGPHTIHWHGIEPDPRNDGVGHTSFEVTGEYTYQWLPQVSVPGDVNCGTSGTYFYHCHVNTALHVQMGMFGPVIIDPIVDPAYPVSPGARRASIDGPQYDIATETLLLPYGVEPRWHGLNHAAGLSGEDVGLNRFEPTHFYVLGGNLAQPGTPGGVATLSQMQANVKRPGRFPTLLRINNASYFPTRVRFTDHLNQPVVMAEALGHDGRTYRDTSDPAAPSRPVGAAGNPIMTSVVAFGAAERYNVLLHPPTAGDFRIHIDWDDWITEKTIATRVVEVIAS